MNNRRIFAGLHFYNKLHHLFNFTNFISILNKSHFLEARSLEPNDLPKSGSEIIVPTTTFLATPHGRAPLLNETFARRWISRGRTNALGALKQSSRSPDFTSCNYYFL